jgi:FixJ family two-component response regulator
LDVAERTVKAHRQQVMEKCEVQTGLSRCLLKLLRQAPKGESYAAWLWRSIA